MKNVQINLYVNVNNFVSNFILMCLTYMKFGQSKKYSEYNISNRTEYFVLNNIIKYYKIHTTMSRVPSTKTAPCDTMRI